MYIFYLIKILKNMKLREREREKYANAILFDITILLRQYICLFFLFSLIYYELSYKKSIKILSKFELLPLEI